MADVIKDNGSRGCGVRGCRHGKLCGGMLVDVVMFASQLKFLGFLN